MAVHQGLPLPRESGQVSTVASPIDPYNGTTPTAIATILFTLILLGLITTVHGSSKKTTEQGGDDFESVPLPSAETLLESGAPGRRQAAPVPFFYRPSFRSSESDDVSPEDPPFLDLVRALDRYRGDASSALAALGRAEDAARRSEWAVFGSEGDSEDSPLIAARLRAKIGRMAEAMEEDGDVLGDLLRPFEVTRGLSPPPPPEVREGGEEYWYRHEGDTAAKISEGDNKKTMSSYESAQQVVTHIVRDWTKDGSGIRRSLYSWCVDQLLLHSRGGPEAASPVLVPGAGLGRLAVELSQAGYAVEANDCSVTMAAAAFQFLNGVVTPGVLHPFLFDFMINELDSARKCDTVTFPDTSQLASGIIRDEVSIGSLSYTLGDFVEIYSERSLSGGFGSVVTCFFIDTATNIYEYLVVIRNALRPGGLWLNVGPLQWHQNALIHPSADELRELISAFGFEIKHWSVDRDPLNYRHDRDRDRFTKMEAYLPLRFVAVRRQDVLGTRVDNYAEKVVEEMRTLVSVAAKSRVFTDKAARTSGHTDKINKTTDEKNMSCSGVTIEELG